MIRVEFDPEIISYDDLLTVFFASHDPTSLNKQGNDVGTQYRSIILYTSEEQKNEAEVFIQRLNEGKVHERPIVTEVESLRTFFEAEAYHHQYFINNPDKAYCQRVINPKLEKVKKRFSELMDDSV